MTIPGAVALTGLVLFVVFFGLMVAQDITKTYDMQRTYRIWGGITFGLSMAVFVTAIWLEVLS